MATGEILLLVFVFVIAGFLGVELISKVPSQLHTPLIGHERDLGHNYSRCCLGNCGGFADRRNDKQYLRFCSDSSRNDKRYRRLSGNRQNAGNVQEEGG